MRKYLVAAVLVTVFTAPAFAVERFYLAYDGKRCEVFSHKPPARSRRSMGGSKFRPSPGFFTQVTPRQCLLTVSLTPVRRHFGDCLILGPRDDPMGCFTYLSDSSVLDAVRR